MSRSVKRSLRQIGSKGVRLYRLFARRCAIGFCKAHRRTGEREKNNAFNVESYLHDSASIQLLLFDNY